MPLDLSNWMGLLADSKLLSELSIPGTHDSASRYLNDPRLVTQTASIGEQLGAGIRFLDIRVGYAGGRFRLYHEDTYLNLRFGQVRDVCKTFLQSHPRETIIMSLKKEDKAPSDGNVKGVNFQSRFAQYVAETPKLWYLGNNIPTLGDARGKIVLFRRFAIDKATPTDVGINAFDEYPNPAGGSTFTIKGPPKLEVQDEFGLLNTKIASKWDAIEKLLTRASAPGNTSVLYVNFCSAAGKLEVDYPLSATSTINPKLEAYFTSHPKGRFGIVLTDFQTTDINTRIVRTNGIGG